MTTTTPAHRSHTCQQCSQPAPDGNDLCTPCETQAGHDALTILRSLTGA